MRLIFISIVGLLSLVKCEANDKTCLEQAKGFKIDLREFLEGIRFPSESKHSIKMDWLGEDSKKILLVSTEPQNSWFSASIQPSDVYFSDNDGKNFTKITNKLGTEVFISSEFGFNKNPHNPQNVIFVAYDKASASQSSLFITTNAAIDWKKVSIPFIVNAPLLFHPKKEFSNNILTVDISSNLYLSQDGGLTWKLIHNNVKEATWSSHPSDSERVIYLLQMSNTGIPATLSHFMDMILQRLPMFNLQKSVDWGSNWSTLQSRVYSLYFKNKFIYCVIVDPENQYQRHMRVSTDAGQTFAQVQLPTITRDQFYSILDIENDLVFMHVDDPAEGMGQGTLYTSDSTGVLFSESLHNHLYMTEEGDASDFTQINSIRGTYITTRILPDKTLETVITYNRGAEWRPLRTPEGYTCPADGKTCSLQISNQYSLSNSVVTRPPLSVENAPGLVLAHGHVASNLKSTPPDVYLSNDGGYNWRKTLDGPHFYEIADHGGLIVAVPANESSPKVVKFSTDEGYCWHELAFINTTHENGNVTFHFTAMLTEPGSKSMRVALWSYAQPWNQWLLHTLDFARLMPRACNESDYEPWYPHSEMTHPNGEQYKGCLLGIQEVFLRLSHDSLCSNGYAHKKSVDVKYCPCTLDDYECEFGYHRTENSANCSRNPSVDELDVCIAGNRERIITEGYRLIPGDQCHGGVQIEKTTQKMLQKNCTHDENGFQIASAPAPVPSDKKKEVPSNVQPVTQPSPDSLVHNDKNLFSTSSSSTPSQGFAAANTQSQSASNVRGVVVIFSVITMVLGFSLLLALVYIVQRRKLLRRAVLAQSGTASAQLHYHLLPNGEVVPSPHNNGNSHSASTQRYESLVNEVEGDASLVRDAHQPFSAGHGGLEKPGSGDPPLLSLEDLDDDDDVQLLQ